MIQIVLAIVVTILYLIIFLIWGTNITRLCGTEKKIEIVHALLFGYFMYYLAFECVAIAMKILGLSVTFLTQVWIIVVTIVTIFSALANSRFMIQSVKQWMEEFSKKKGYYLVFSVLTIFIFVLIVSITPVTMGVQDDSYYIADVMTSIFTDTIQQYDFATGVQLSSYDLSYFIPMYPMHGAVVYKLTSLHPVVENKWCSAFVVLLLSNLVYWNLSRKVYRNNEKRAMQLLGLMMFFRFNYVLWGKAAATFFFYRISEGKGILANLILPALILFFWEAMEKERRFGWLPVELVILAAFSISMSSMFLVSVSLGCLMVAGFVTKRQAKLLIPYSVCTFSCICMVAVYEALVRGIITVPIL